MKKLLFNGTRSLMTLAFLMILNTVAFAQEKVNVNGHDVGTWFKNNWLWVAGIVVLLLLIILFSGGGGSRRKTTTVVKDNYGDVKRVTTMEEED